MKKFRAISVAFVGFQAAIPNARAGLTLYQPDLNPILRASGFQSYPLATDSSGDVYTVTGTSTSDRLLEITASGQVLTISQAVGSVVGTNAKMTFGFGGNLFVTSNGAILEFSPGDGTRSEFFSGAQDGDAAVAYDPSRQILWVSNSGPTNNDIIGLNVNRYVVETIKNASFGGYGMALDKSGNLILMTATGVIESINPATQSISQIADLTSTLPNADIRSLAIDPNTGNLFFSDQYGGPDPSIAAFNGLYEISPDGSGLKLIASGFNGQMAFGASSAGNGRLSIYLGDPENYQLFEVQSVAGSVPEPSTFALFGVGLLGIAAARKLKR